MKYNIHGNKMKITAAIKDHVNVKLKKLEKYFTNPEEIEAKITTKVRGHEQIIEVTIPTNSFILRAEESHSNLYSAIDLVIDKLEKQIRKNKTRIKKRVKDDTVKEFNLDFEEEMLEELEEKEVVKFKKIDRKPMSIEDAVLEMNLIGHDFFVYNDRETNSIAVLYRRKDGHYGVIETN